MTRYIKWLYKSRRENFTLNIIPQPIRRKFQQSLSISSMFLFSDYLIQYSAKKNPVYYKIFCGLLSCIKCMICASTSPYRFEKFKYIVKIHAQNFTRIFTVLNICMPFIYNAVFTLKQVLTSGCFRYARQRTYASLNEE